MDQVVLSESSEPAKPGFEAPLELIPAILFQSYVGPNRYPLVLLLFSALLWYRVKIGITIPKIIGIEFLRLGERASLVTGYDFAVTALCDSMP